MLAENPDSYFSQALVVTWQNYLKLLLLSLRNFQCTFWCTVCCSLWEEKINCYNKSYNRLCTEYYLLFSFM